MEFHIFEWLKSILEIFCLGDSITLITFAKLSRFFQFFTIFWQFSHSLKCFFFSIWKYEKVKSLILRSSIVVEEKLTKENLVFHSLAVSLNDFFFVKLNFNAVLQFVYCTIKFDNYGHKLLKKLFSKIIMQGYWSLCNYKSGNYMLTLVVEFLVTYYLTHFEVHDKCHWYVSKIQFKCVCEKIEIYLDSSKVAIKL